MPFIDLSQPVSQAVDSATSAAKLVAQQVLPGPPTSVADARLKVAVGAGAMGMHALNQMRQYCGFLTEVEKKRAGSATGWNGNGHE